VRDVFERVSDTLAAKSLDQLASFDSELDMPEVELAFIARQLERLVNDVTGLKDDMAVVMARLGGLDATTHSLVTEVRAMHSRHDRVAKRVEHFGDAGCEAPS
jgi:predicted  nucleic acid-binding Zn-ribbon protein